jgi:hypothetical protein
MVLNKNKLRTFSESVTQVNFIKDNYPGLYFLFDSEYKLVYIGESLLPLSRISDHYFKAYAGGKSKKGIGPIFNYFRIMQIKDEDFRIRQHFEKRWIKKYEPPVNANGQNSAPYPLSYNQIRDFISVYETFFKNMSWFTYINDEVIKKMPCYSQYRNKKRRQRALKQGNWRGL